MFKRCVEIIRKLDADTMCLRTMVRRFLRIIIGVPLLLSSTFSVSKAISETLIVGVASNFSAPFMQIQRDFFVDTGHTLKPVFASSGKLYAQIVNGAPIDVFLSADTLKTRALVEAGFAEDKSRYIYAQGQIALLASPSAAGRAQALFAQQLTDAELIKRLLLPSAKVALANPKLAPYGRAANSILSEFFLLETKPKIIYAENISQAFHFVESSSVSFGFVAYAHILQKKVPASRYRLLDDLRYPEIHQEMLVLNRSENKQAAPPLWCVGAGQDSDSRPRQAAARQPLAKSAQRCVLHLSAKPARVPDDRNILPASFHDVPQ